MPAAAAPPPPAGPIVFTYTPAGQPPQVALLAPSGALRILTRGFFAAADPDVSFDAARILFAGRKTAHEPWQIYEMELAAGAVRRITSLNTDCRQPIYQSRIFSLDIPDPWPQVAFVAGHSLHTIKFDGALHQRITFTPSEDFDPAMLPDGRMIYASRQQARTQLMGVNLDGTDYALFLPGGDLRSPAVTTDGRVVFVEGKGALAAVDLLRPLHTRRILTTAADGIFSTPSALPGGRLLVSWQPAPSAPAGIYQLQPATKARIPVFVRPGVDARQARLVAPRPEPDGRGSVVDDAADWAKLYCLSVYTTDQPRLIRPGAATRLRVLAGPAGAPRKLGEFQIEQDGSFHLEVPPNEPLKLELLDSGGKTLRSSAWIFVRKKEQRGCIGCHEDPELTPENREAQAIVKKAIRLIPPVPATNGDSK